MKTPSHPQQISTFIKVFGFRFRNQTAYSTFSVAVRAATIAASFFLFLTAPSRAQFAYVANADSGDISAYSIDSNGSLTPVPGSPFAAGIEPFSVSVDFMARFAYATNFSGNNVSAYHIDANGALTPVSGSPFETGAGPISVAVDPMGRFVYVANSGDNNVSAYTIGSSGPLSPVPGAPFSAGFAPVCIAAGPTGKSGHDD